MQLFFDPETVAEIGATDQLMRPGHHLFQNLLTSFGERFYPINPRLSKIGSKTCYPNILEVPAEIDVAVVFIPAAAVPDALEQCAKKGVRRVIIESGGFAEVGGKGRRLTERCLAIAREAGMRLWGPNCMGLLNVPRKKILSFMIPMMWQDRLVTGPVSLVVQSGMLSAGFLIHILSRTPFGLAKVCSIGNKVDVDEVDLLEYLVQDPDTGVIAMYLESLSKGRRFFELARAAKKSLVVLKAGRSAYGALAARSHTAALAQDDRVLDAAFRQAGVIRVHDLFEMMDVARSLAVAAGTRTPRSRVAVLTFSGGAGVVCGDGLFDLGLELAELEEATLAKIKTVFPDWMEASNPVDLYPAVEKSGPTEPYRLALEAVMADPGVDAVFVHLFAPPIKMPLFDYEQMAALARRHHKPIVAWVMGHGDTAQDIARELERRGIPVLDEIRKGLRVLAALTARR
ncbi:MAG: hypothetical protein A2V67_05495 [Deltaproteobacteria bacterium RBG_13_61_14]|nr:MAG: hypothetical protein A2V67_05495 [Deltaproteobacteria bacterium RBG_13_61_14]